MLSFGSQQTIFRAAKGKVAEQYAWGTVRFRFPVVKDKPAVCAKEDVVGPIRQNKFKPGQDFPLQKRDRPLLVFSGRLMLAHFQIPNFIACDEPNLPIGAFMELFHAARRRKEVV